MGAIQAIIADDEILAIRRLELLLKECENIEVVGVFNDGYEAIKEINNLTPDLLFLDIQFPNVTGFDIVKQLKKTPVVIFITAYDRHAIEAFNVFAFDFLVKPFKDERFYQTIKRVQDHFDTIRQSTEQRLEELMNKIQFLNDHSNRNLGVHKIPIKLGNKINLIPTEDIKYILASGYYSEIYTDKKKHVLRESMTNLIEQLGSQPFARIHRSSIVNFNFIEELVYSDFGELDVKMKDGRLLRVSHGFKRKFFLKLGIEKPA